MPEGAPEDAGGFRPIKALPPRREPTNKDEHGEDKGSGGDQPDRKLSRLMPSKEVVLEEASDPFESIEDKEWAGGADLQKKSVLAVALGILVLITALFFILHRMNPEVDTNDISQEDRLRALNEARNAALRDLAQREDEARDVFSDYANAKVVEEILPLIRDAGELEELIRKVGHHNLVQRKWEPSKDAKWAQFLMVDNFYARLSGQLPDFSNYSAYFVVENDNLLIDWKATTAYGTAAFSELSQGKGDGSEIRGTIRTASFYAKAFPERDYQSYQFESPDRREMIWCYVKRGSKQAKQLASFFGRGEIVKGVERELPLTLKLERNMEGALPNQWLIEELLHKDWIEF